MPQLDDATLWRVAQLLHQAPNVTIELPAVSAWALMYQLRLVLRLPLGGGDTALVALEVAGLLRAALEAHSPELGELAQRAGWGDA